jgi:hypothetical protein
VGDHSFRIVNSCGPMNAEIQVAMCMSCRHTSSGTHQSNRRPEARRAAVIVRLHNCAAQRLRPRTEGGGVHFSVDPGMCRLVVGPTSRERQSLRCPHLWARQVDFKRQVLRSAGLRIRNRTSRRQ